MRYHLALLIFIASVLTSAAQSIAINTDGSSPHISAMLDVKSTTKGLLIPRMTMAQRNLISNPAAGLMIYQTDNTSGHYFYNGGAWVPLASGGVTNFWSSSGINIYNNNSGFVGIGTENPLTKLHLKKDGEAMIIQGTVPHISFYDNAGTYKGFLWQGPGDNISIGTTPSNPNGHIEFYNNNQKNLSLFSNGFLQLAGSNAKLELWDDGYRSGSIEATDYSTLEIAAARTELIGGIPGNLILQTNVTTQLGTAFAGNVGIGTFFPIGKLQIRHPGPTAHLVLEHPTLNEYSRLVFSNSGGNRYWGIAGRTSNGPISDDRLSFYNISTGFETMVMVGDGYVSVPGKMGIGTFNPAYKFAVNGSIRSKEVVVESAWADYVFNDDYVKPTLLQLEKYIRQNKHLPNIPSAEEIEENGLHLGDIQKRMMEKIEELTLYVIELKKEIEILKSRK